MDVQSLVFTFLGGIGIFLFAVKFMGDGLQKAAGDRLRDLLDKFTTKPSIAVLPWILVTQLFHGSNGTAVLTFGLVNEFGRAPGGDTVFFSVVTVSL